MNEYKKDLLLQGKNPFRTWHPICSRANLKLKIKKKIKKSYHGSQIYTWSKLYN